MPVCQCSILFLPLCLDGSVLIRRYFGKACTFSNMDSRLKTAFTSLIDGQGRNCCAAQVLESDHRMCALGILPGAAVATPRRDIRGYIDKVTPCSAPVWARICVSRSQRYSWRRPRARVGMFPQHESETLISNVTIRWFRSCPAQQEQPLYSWISLQSHILFGCRFVRRDRRDTLERFPGQKWLRRCGTARVSEADFECEHPAWCSWRLEPLIGRHLGEDTLYLCYYYGMRIGEFRPPKKLEKW